MYDYSDVLSETDNGLQGSGISARARERAARRIAEAYAHGRLHRDGFEVRTQRALSATSRTELDAATRDLPRVWDPVTRLRRALRQATRQR